MSGFAGNMYILGMPYANNSMAATSGCYIYYTGGVGLPSGYTLISGVVNPNSSNVLFIAAGGTTTSEPLPTSYFGANGSINGTCVYNR